MAEWRARYHLRENCETLDCGIRNKITFFYSWASVDNALTQAALRVSGLGFGYRTYQALTTKRGWGTLTTQ